ncbi:N-(5'-phosphoribosyl)anthranilate isomerase 1, chloroplastic [Galdieria sulphuraria]|nr:N-(5'-phosphoribosyl)anthranilate isomerase 1, chloroplastic [Galdieria sulphuraria]
MSFIACLHFRISQRPSCQWLLHKRRRLLFPYVGRKSSSCVVQAHLELIKICGITCKEDASMVCEAIEKRKQKKPYDAIRFLLGVIFCSTSKRNVSLESASQIVETVGHFGNAQVVGVFVYQDASSIISICQQTGISIAQLHGDGSRRSLRILPGWIESIPVLSVHHDGSFDSDLLEQWQLKSWILFDSPGGGTGKTFSWDNFQPPQHLRWILAGGICTDNIQSALNMLSPPGIDISSGVCQPNGIRKCPELVGRFLDLCVQPMS